MEVGRVDGHVELDDVGAGQDRQQVRQLLFGQAGILRQRVAAHTRSMYEPSRVSTRILSPVLTNNGTWMTLPVSSVAGLVPPVAVSPLKPGSVLVTSSTTLSGRSTPTGSPSYISTSSSMPSFRYSTASPSWAPESGNCSYVCLSMTWWRLPSLYRYC